MMNTWWLVLMTQIWHLPFLAIYILGLVLSLTRKDLGNARSYAAIGFSLQIVAMMISTASMYFMYASRENGMFGPDTATRTAVFGFAMMVVNIAAWILILAAIFAKRPPPPLRVE
jgi:hypothetical protein